MGRLARARRLSLPISALLRCPTHMRRDPPELQSPLQLQLPKSDERFKDFDQVVLVLTSIWGSESPGWRTFPGGVLALWESSIPFAAQVQDP